MSRNQSKGFTLVELLVVVAIIGILAAVAVGNYRQSIIRAKEAVLKANLFEMRSQINIYFADKGRYPADLQALVDESYLSKMPIDPITEADDTWIEEYAIISDADISTEPGIANVISGAAGVSQDGTNYADW